MQPENSAKEVSIARMKRENGDIYVQSVMLFFVCSFCQAFLIKLERLEDFFFFLLLLQLRFFCFKSLFSNNSKYIKSKNNTDEVPERRREKKKKHVCRYYVYLLLSQWLSFRLVVVLFRLYISILLCQKPNAFRRTCFLSSHTYTLCSFRIEFEPKEKRN